MAGIVDYKKLSTTEYNSLSSKDEDSLYAVIENGDFSEENLDDTADLFLGDKYLSAKVKQVFFVEDAFFPILFSPLLSPTQLEVIAEAGFSSKAAVNPFTNTISCNISGSAAKVNNALTIKNGSTTDTYNGSAAKSIDLTKLGSIGNVASLQTSNKTTIVDAINEVNAKANQGSSGTINDSTISPFAGFVNIADIIIEETTFVGTGGSVLYYLRQNMFLLTDGRKYYKDWTNYSLYNTSNSTNASARVDKLFSYNDQHYMVINGSLQDISNIEKVLKSYSDANKEVAINAANTIAANQANNALTLAKNYANNVGSTTLANAQRFANTAESNANTYTDTTIAAKIQLVSALPSKPAAGVLYLIPDEE